MISESEWLTRKKRIDSRLTALGWKIVRFSEGIGLSSLDKVAVEELPTASGPADYGLFVTGRLLGIIEAKKVAVNPQNVDGVYHLECARRFFLLGSLSKRNAICRVAGQTAALILTGHAVG